MSATLTPAGLAYLASCNGTSTIASFTEFRFAFISDLDVDALPDDTDWPAAILHTQPVNKKGYVNPNSVAVSCIVGSDAPEFTFNWIGLANAAGDLCGVIYQETATHYQSNIAAGTTGSNIARTFLVNYSSAQTLMAVTLPAESWQLDFTERLESSDRVRLATSQAIAGMGKYFFNDALTVSQSGATYSLKAGKALLCGMPLVLAADADITAKGLGAERRVWLETWEMIDNSSRIVAWDISTTNLSGTKTDYVDSAGRKHCYTLIAEISVAGVITDKRASSGTVMDADDIFSWFAEHILDTDNPHGVTKAQVGLGNLPNAKSDDIDLEDSETLATSQAVADAVAAALAADVRSASIVVQNGAMEYPPQAHGGSGLPLACALWAEFIYESPESGHAVGDQVLIPQVALNSHYYLEVTATHVDLRWYGDPSAVVLPHKVTGALVEAWPINMKITARLTW